MDCEMPRRGFFRKMAGSSALVITGTIAAVAERKPPSPAVEANTQPHITYEYGPQGRLIVCQTRHPAGGTDVNSPNSPPRESSPVEHCMCYAYSYSFDRPRKTRT